MAAVETAHRAGPGAGGWSKAAFDFAFASVALLVLGPLMVAIAVAIRLSSHGPVLFKQQRRGLHGRPFTLLKFRTMHNDASARLVQVRALNEAPGPVFNIRRDPRVVPGIGSFLRNTNLDELPQLLNVLRGDMSIVGPRPHEDFVVEQYQPWHWERLQAKPGLTCTWQVQPNRHQVPFDEWMRMDLEYLATRTLAADCRLIGRTVLMLVRS
jgi:lipopolysaccharide/colanic/teichoic acid biosynthesis glycosyltransferase